VRCARCNGSGRLNVATVDGRCAESAAVITSRRLTASSYAQSTRSSVPFQFTALAISVMVPSWWSTAAMSVASSNSMSGSPRSSTASDGSRSSRRTRS
jgi:hypothetical protein